MKSDDPNPYVEEHQKDAMKAWRLAGNQAAVIEEDVDGKAVPHKTPYDQHNNYEVEKKMV
jgi:hypothetical protein